MLLEVGSVVRAHGLRGQVVIELTSNRPERHAVGAVLDGGGRPLEITASAPAPGGAGRDRWLVSLRGVTTREQAEALRGTTLRAEALADPDALWVHELIGARVLDGAGNDRGVVVDVEANPASDLLVLDSGVLVPLTFVTAHDAGQVRVEGPEGLWG